MRVDVFKYGFFLLLVLTLIFAPGCKRSEGASSASRVPGSPEEVVVDQDRCEVRFWAIVQKTDAPRMDAWAQASPALLGSRGGKFNKYFVFLTDAEVTRIHDALFELGARGKQVYRISEAVKHKGFRADNSPADYMLGDPVQILVEWDDSGHVKCLSYEDFFLEKITVGEAETVKSWTPDFVFHGSGVLNNKTTGCIACTHDCPGGIIGNNQYPLIEPIPVLRADWNKLPPPGTRVLIVIKPVPSGKIRAGES